MTHGKKCDVQVAGWTGLEPAASGVTGRRYNQLNYHPFYPIRLKTFGSRCIGSYF